MANLGLLIGAAALGSVTALAAVIRSALEPSFQSGLASARIAAYASRPEAESLVRRMLARRPSNPEGLWLLGSIYSERDDPFGAVACFRKVAGSELCVGKARIAEGDYLLRFGDALAAEIAWTSAEQFPVLRPEVEKRLLLLYSYQMRRSEWAEIIWRRVLLRRAGFRDLIQLMLAEHIDWHGDGVVETLERYVSVNPGDRISRSSLVHHLLVAGNIDEAKVHVRYLLDGDSSTPEEAFAIMDYAVADADPGVVESFLARSGKQVKGEILQSSMWLRGLGELELQRSALQKATSLLLASARKSPFHPTCRQQLSVALRLQGRYEEAAMHAAAAATLAHIEGRCFALRNADKNEAVEEIYGLVKEAASIGMIGEAKAWVRFVTIDRPKDSRWKRFADRLSAVGETSRLNPPASFLDPRQELLHWSDEST